MPPEFKTTRTPPSRCPGCFYLIDAASARHQHKPKPNDIGICASCGMFFVFNQDLTVREALPEDLIDISTDDFMRMKYVQDTIRKRGLLNT